jgi:hypothetical protein
MVYTPRGRVVVTTVTPEGKSIFEEDAAIAIGPLPGASIRRFYNVDQVPVDGPVQTSHVHEEDFNSKKGATPSIDFGVVISGEIVLILDDRAETTLK